MRMHWRLSGLLLLVAALFAALAPLLISSAAAAPALAPASAAALAGRRAPGLARAAAGGCADRAMLHPGRSGRQDGLRRADGDLVHQLPPADGR